MAVGEAGGRREKSQTGRWALPPPPQPCPRTPWTASHTSHSLSPDQLLTVPGTGRWDRRPGTRERGGQEQSSGCPRRLANGGRA